MNPLLKELEAEVAENTVVIDSAVILIKGIATRIKDAIDAALENGATAKELEPLSKEVAALKSSSKDLAEAVAEHTPAA